MSRYLYDINMLEAHQRPLGYLMHCAAFVAERRISAHCQIFVIRPHLGTILIHLKADED